jgi:4'-phosphopantetheinyl transferase
VNTSACVRVWTLLVDALHEPAIDHWRTVLDPEEQARTDRFLFARHRVQFIAAHALLRHVLSLMVTDVPASAWRLIAGDNGKPMAWIGDQPAPLSFNLSHTEGMVGVAVVPWERCALGFDLEPLDRKVTLDIARQYFRIEEIDWLASLTDAAKAEGFLRLWTLKEAFIKATGEGLSRDLATFWFTPSPPHIHFTADQAERSQDWHFEQRIIASRFIAAVGLNQPQGTALPARWTQLVPDPGAADQGIDQILLRTWS